MKLEPAVKDLSKVLKAIELGAQPIKTEFHNRTEYGVEYPTGGYFRVTKLIYEKLTT
jgi:hypothetical protein